MCDVKLSHHIPLNLGVAFSAVVELFVRFDAQNCKMKPGCNKSLDFSRLESFFIFLMIL